MRRFFRTSITTTYLLLGLSAPAFDIRTVVFRVIDADSGGPLEGASLNGKFVTGIDGSCAVPLGFPSNVWVRLRGYVPRVASFGVSDERINEYTFRLERGETIGGTVLDDSGRPVQNAVVSIVGPPLDPKEREHIGLQHFTPLATTDAAGRWVSSEIPRIFESIDLALSHSEYRQGYYSTAPRQFFPGTRAQPRSITMAELKSRRIVMTLAPGIALQGMVADAAGKPVPEAAVRLAEAMNLRVLGSTLTGRDGRFRFGNAEEGTAVVTVQARGYAPESRTVEITRTTSELRLQLSPSRGLRGRVLDEFGNPIVGAAVVTEAG